MDEQARDIFISYSSKDREFVERLARDLMARGLRVWWDRLEMKVGDSLNRKIQEGILRSSWLAVVLSPDSVASRWVEKQLNAALERELQKEDVFVLPILYRTCAIPLFLRDKVYADFRTSYEQGVDTLLERVVPRLDINILRTLMSEKPTAILSRYADLSKDKKPVYANELIAKLSSAAPGERLAALTALFTIREPTLQPHLLSMAKDPSSAVRRWVVFYLGQLRARNALPILSALLSDKSPDVRAEARDAYRKITGHKA
jgi:hypothetical protein